MATDPMHTGIVPGTHITGSSCPDPQASTSAGPLDDLVLRHSGENTLATPTPEFGRCRRHAPTMSGYPAVFGHDWCGDHKLDEESLVGHVEPHPVLDDPWAHRTSGMRCSTCMWFVEKVR